MLRYRRLTYRSGFGDRGWGIGDGNYLEDAERLWVVIMDGYPYLGAA